jgi:hypothetical protein
MSAANANTNSIRLWKKPTKDQWLAWSPPGSDGPSMLRLRHPPVADGADFQGLRRAADFATDRDLGFAIPMMIGAIVAACSVAIAMVFSPETKGKQLVSEIQLV